MLRDNLFLASLAVLILLVVAVLGLVLWMAVRRSSAKGAADPKLARLRFDSLRNSFRQAVELIEANIASRSERYSIPWVLVLNETHGQLPIEQSGVASALSTEAAMAASAQGISWHFFDRGIVVDIQGAYLGSPDDEDAAEKPWDEFLGLCRKYRPERPFDSVVITVPASLLLDDKPDARLELAKLAKLAHRRLWLAQNRFAMRFAVYVVVSGCEEIEGFAQFARLVPESVRASMLGWSSPYDLSTTYQAQWVDDAIDAVVKTTTDTSAELFALNAATEDAGKFFLLPSRIESIRSQLQLYVDELMRPSAYHEPFFFRGMYLTGDSSEAAQKAMGAHSLPAVVDAAAEPAPVETHELMSQLMREPAFLRDLFEKKIFLEYGLARPSRQHLTRPALSRTARWGAIAVLGTWAVGLLVATWQLNTRYTYLAQGLSEVHEDSQEMARAEAAGKRLDPEWYKNRAKSMLDKIEKLSVKTVWTVFMPGSAKVFDNLEERAIAHISDRFGEIATKTLTRELYRRAAELTGATQDASTGTLITGECAAPSSLRGLDTGRKLTLVVEETQEFKNLQDYLIALEQLDKAIWAMLRVTGPTQTEAADLRFLVKYTLGSEMQGDVQRSLQYFRGVEGASQSTRTLQQFKSIQEATHCAFSKGMAALDWKLFAGNDLLATEDRLAKLSARLFTPTAGSASYADAVEGYREVQAIIREQENLIASGKATWMRQPALTLGAGFDGLVKRAAAISLLGNEQAEQARQRSAFAFQRFTTDLSMKLGTEASAGVVWVEKEGRFTLSAERASLRDGLAAMFNMSFMDSPRELKLPAVPPNAALHWDLARLDAALLKAEERKRFRNEVLPKFPLAARRSVEVFADGQLARMVRDQVAESLTVVTRADGAVSLDATTFEAARQRLTRVHGLLVDLGAIDRAEELRIVLAQDASIRLRHIDEALMRSELYALRGRDFRWWQGDRSPLWQSFGVQDGAAMLQYLAQQSSRAEALARQADAYIGAMDAGSASGQMLLRWQAINRDLDRYRLKNPNSSLVGLEQFLVTLGGDLDRFNCTEKLAAKSPGSRPADYFAERHLHIYTVLMTRCNELRTRDQQDQWAQFSGNFNKLVAGRQPFTQAAVRDTPVADFEDVGTMLKTYERVSKVLKEMQVDPGRAATPSAPARRFVDQFERVKSFLAPLYPTEEGAIAGYDVVAEFRANQAAEVEGNKVIDWTLEIGGQVLRFRDPPKVLRWEPGAPVTLTLRLAKDSPTTPVMDVHQGAMQVDGKAVIFRFNDPWALLTMIQRQREPDGGARADGRSQLLRIEFPLSVASEDAKAPPLEARSRVYLRLSLSPVGKKSPLSWPGIFPVRAPEWTGP